MHRDPAYGGLPFTAEFLPWQILSQRSPHRGDTPATDRNPITDRPPSEASPRRGEIPAWIAFYPAQSFCGGSLTGGGPVAGHQDTGSPVSSFTAFIARCEVTWATPGSPDNVSE